MRKPITFVITALVTATLILVGLVFYILYYLNQDKTQPPAPAPRPGEGEEVVFPGEELFRPEPAPLEKTDKILAHVRGEIETFWLQNGRRYKVIDDQTIKLMRGIPGWDRVFEIKPKELEQYQPGPDFIASHPRSDGLLIQMQGSPHIFKVEQARRTYLSPQTFENLGLNQKDIILVSTKIVKKVVLPAPEIAHLTLQDAVKQGNAKIISTGIFFRDIARFIAGPYEQDTAINIRKGDVLLSKQGKQSLTVTQDFEIFVPKGEQLVLEGVMGACIDRFKQWPLKGEALDVTLNLADWNLKSATTLLDLLEVIDAQNVNTEQFSQDAIWQVTDQQPASGNARLLLQDAGIDPELFTSFLHLSNPLPRATSSFVLPPELSLPGLVASQIANCPEGRQADFIICQDEIEFAMEVYLQQKPFPGTIDQKVEAKTLQLLIEYFLSQKPIGESLPAALPETIRQTALALVQTAKNRGFKPQTLQVSDVKILPSRELEQEIGLFVAEGKGIQEIQVSVKNIDGQTIFTSPLTFGNMYEWKVRDNQGNSLPIGFYSFTIEVTGFDGKKITTTPRQLIIRSGLNR